MSIKNKIIFIIDDDREIIQLLTKILTYEGMAVISAANLTDAKNILATTRPHLIFLDIKLGQENGLTFLSFLKTSPLSKGLPVIMFSGIDESKITKFALSAGAVDFVTKPVVASQLLQKIRKHLTSSKSKNYCFIDYHNYPQPLSINATLTHFNQNVVEMETNVKIADATGLHLKSSFCEHINFFEARFVNKGKINNLGKGKYLHKLYYVGITEFVINTIVHGELV
jgi:DNA-binding response OmpR family regulator